MTLRKPQPRYGWRGQTQTSDRPVVGDRVYHEMAPDNHGTIVDGPLTVDTPSGEYQVYVITWDSGRTYRHTAETIKKVGA